MPNRSYDLRAYPLFRSVIGGGAKVAKSKRCFVIDPSHDADANVRKHADTLWKYVIQPALLDSDYSARRADRTLENAPTDQGAIDAVLDDDLIIAVPSFGNARVFYETALAQAAARPLILMIEEGQQLGFDPRNAEIVTYKLDPDSIVGATNVARLQAVVSEIEERWHAPSHGFRLGTAALNAGHEGSATFEHTPRSRHSRLLGMMREATRRVDIMGVSNLALALHDDTASVIRQIGAQGVEVRILQCSPTNPGLASLIGARDSERVDAVKQRIVTATDAWRSLADAADGEISLTVRRVQTSLPMANAMITDHAVVATPYLHCRRPNESPTLFAKGDDPWRQTMCEEFSALWAEATTVFRIEPRIQLQRDMETNAGPGPLFAKPHLRPGSSSDWSSTTTDDRGFAVIRTVGGR